MVLVWSLAFVGSGLLAAPPVSFEGEKVCPSPGAMARELERMVTVPEGTEPREDALVVVEGSEIRVVLVTKDGRLLGERRLPAEGTCDERALSVAVVLGAWLASEHPEYVGTLPDAREKAPAAAATATAPPPEPVAPPPPPPTPAKAPAPAPPSEKPTPQSSAAGAAWRFRPALAAGVELSDAGVVPAGELSLGYAPAGSSLGVSAFVLLAGSEERSVGSGSVSSFRWPLGVGGVGRLELGDLAFELDAGPMLGLLHLEGKGFTTNDAATDVQGGVYGALRFAPSTGRLRPFVAAKLLTWLGTATVSARLPDAELDLPVVEGVFVAGVAWAP